MSEGETLKELVQFLSLETRPDVRGTAMDYMLGLTASKDNTVFFHSNPELIPAIVKVTGDSNYPPIARDAFGALINLSGHDSLVEKMNDAGVLQFCLDTIVDPKAEFPDPACMLLANLTRVEKIAEEVLKIKINDRPALQVLVDIFCRTDFNEKGQFHYLANVIFNLTQLKDGRKQIKLRSDEGCIFQRLLAFVEFKESDIRRGGSVGAIRNCCFDSEDHEWLFSDEVNILPYLLLPLAGPEEFDDDETLAMPDELQFLPPDKTREPDADIRKMFIEALIQLGATRSARDMFREKKIYPILRELHKWEKEEDVKDCCEQLVQLIIADEDEEVDNLKEADVEELMKKASLDAGGGKNFRTNQEKVVYPQLDENFGSIEEVTGDKE